MRLATILEMGGDALSVHCDRLFWPGVMDRDQDKRRAWHAAIHYLKEMSTTATEAGLTPAGKARRKPCEWMFTYDEKRRLNSLRNACKIVQRQVVVSRWNFDPLEHGNASDIRAYKTAVGHLTLLEEELKRARQFAYQRAVERGQL